MRPKSITITCEQCGKPVQVDSAKRRFCNKSCSSKYNNHHRATGRTLSSHGYVMILNPNYPNDNRPQYIQEHRLVMEAHLGRPLLPDEIVHHINGEKTDNRIENLQVMHQGDHARLHITVDGWTREHPCCIDCGTTERKHAGGGRCRRCHTRFHRNPAFLRIERKDAWALKYDQCVNCGTTERPHRAKGLCSLCSDRARVRPPWTPEMNAAHTERRRKRKAAKARLQQVSSPLPS